MKKLIVCAKESGNTHKVCRYVASNLDVELKVAGKTTMIDLPSYDVIIVASGVYLNRVHKNILRWINSIEKDTVNPDTKVYLFLTWFGRGESDEVAFNEVKQLLRGKGITLEDNYIKCFGGGMGVIKTSHPDEEDCKNVLSWAKDL